MDLLNVKRTSFVLFCSTLLFAACSSDRKEKITAQQKQPPRPPARVDVFVVRNSTVAETIEVPGTLVADEATEIHPEVSGRVTGLYIREGAFTNRGALLAKLYDGDLQAQRRKLEVQLKIAQTTEDRYNQLVKIGGISKQDYDVTALQVSNLRADLDIIRTAIQKTEVRAPFSGKLGLKNISTGAFVTPSSIITSIQKTAGLRIDFNVPEKYTTQIRKGQIINFTVEGSDRNYAATVMATESGIAEATRSLTVRAVVKGDATNLIPGGFAKVKISFEPDTNALLVPTQAVVPQARGKKLYRFKGGTAQLVDVVTGVRDSSMIQISEGISTGDTIITTGLLGLKPDAKVTVGKVVQ